VRVRARWTGHGKQRQAEAKQNLWSETRISAAHR
jgi:hypothetical protein